MNEDIQTKASEEFKLIPLESGQHELSVVPKTTTDFPFFYLTKHKERLTKPIVYEGVDGEGRPVRWAATPNAAIGSPGIDAHETWTRLVKPTWEAYRSPDNRLPNILPLGGVRQCLRAVGWGQGGWEARRLLRALNQIGATWCNADFSVPTSKLTDDGKPTFRIIKGSFSRLTIFAIGEKHLTEEELTDGKFAFAFNLEDTLYIQFHPLEVAIQESQPQRYLDNQYMFSVAPAGRRWYELMAAKIFGVVKNRGDYCEIQYSWYVKHHHTLNRQIAHKRIVQQMNQVVHDHIESGFIARVEYRKIVELGKPIDFLIRYFPGVAAKHSITRVAGAIARKRTLPAGEPRVFTRKRTPAKTIIANPNEEPTAQFEANTFVSNPDSRAVDDPGNYQLAEPAKAFAESLVSRGIFRSQAVKLLSALPPESLERVGDYIAYWDSVRNQKTPGLLVHLIQNGDPLPSGFQAPGQRVERIAAENRRLQLGRLDAEIQRRHAEYCRRKIDQAIAELADGEFERRVAARVEETLRIPGYWSERPEMAMQLARHEVTAEIAKAIALPTAHEFRTRELSKILSDLQLDPAELGVELPELESSTPDKLQNALYEPPSNDSAQTPDPPTPRQSIQPGGV